MDDFAATMERCRWLLRALAIGVPLAATGCAGLDRNDQGLLQPQMVAGPCQMQKFFLRDQAAVHTDMVVTGGSQACSFTMLNPDLQAFPSAVLVTEQPAHGRATAGLANGGRSPIVSYTPQPGYSGPDRFSVTIEPNDHAVAVAVAVKL